MKKFIRLIVVCQFLIAGFSFAEDLTTSSFILRDSAITIMGGHTDSTSFQNISAGQVVAGDSTSASYINQDGILYFNTTASSSGSSSGGGSSYGAGPAPGPSSSSVGIIQKITQKIFGCGLVGDLNKDCRVNIRDASILLYWWGQPQKSLSAASFFPDINNDLLINIKDLSMMLFNWTG